jgi:hypothetical protein
MLSAYISSPLSRLYRGVLPSLASARDVSALFQPSLIHSLSNFSAPLPTLAWWGSLLLTLAPKRRPFFPPILAQPTSKNTLSANPPARTPPPQEHPLRSHTHSPAISSLPQPNLSHSLPVHRLLSPRQLAEMSFSLFQLPQGYPLLFFLDEFAGLSSALLTTCPVISAQISSHISPFQELPSLPSPSLAPVGTLTPHLPICV